MDNVVSVNCKLNCLFLFLNHFCVWKKNVQFFIARRDCFVFSFIYLCYLSFLLEMNFANIWRMFLRLSTFLIIIYGLFIKSSNRNSCWEFPSVLSVFKGRFFNQWLKISSLRISGYFSEWYFKRWPRVEIILSLQWFP